MTKTLETGKDSATMALYQHLSGIATITFCAASQLETPASVKRVITSQSGYIRNREMRIAKASTGGYRLYTRVAGKWMDASLNDIAPAQTAVNPSDLGSALQSLRKHRRGGRPKILTTCPKCGAKMGTRDMRAHRAKC